MLNTIQPGLLNNFMTNIYLPTVKLLSTIYDKKISVLGMAKMCTATEVQMDQPTLFAIIESCANLMGVVAEQGEPE